MLMTNRHRKHSDDTALMASWNERDDNVTDPLLLMCMSLQNATRKRNKGFTSAYNFDTFEEELYAIKHRPVQMKSPLPTLEPLKPSFQSTQSPTTSPRASYRWCMEGDVMNSSEHVMEESIQDVFRPFFTFASHHLDEGEDENVGQSALMSLLHAGSSKYAFTKTPTAHFYSAFSSSSCFTPRVQFRKKKNMDETTYLMHETAISTDWSERQLAFDLEVVEDDPCHDQSHTWMSQPSNVMIESSQITIGQALYLLPQPLVQYPGTLPSAHLKPQQTMYNGLVRETRNNTNACQYRKSVPARHYHCNNKTKQRNVRSSGTGASNRSRKSSKRSPILRGGEFSSNLSTVPERPLEEDASHMLTPRNDQVNNAVETWSFSTPTVR